MPIKRKLNSFCRNIFWVADTNYRIDLDRETVQDFAESDALDSLVAADQVSL